MFETIPLNQPVPLSQGLRFDSVTEHHCSYPSDGRRHTTVKAQGRDIEHISETQSVPLADIKTWLSLRSVDVPLSGAFDLAMNAGPWRDVKQPVVLRSEDFGGACGVCLHAYICRNDCIDQLIGVWRTATRSWLLGQQQLRLVVLAEPFRTTQ